MRLTVASLQVLAALLKRPDHRCYGYELARAVSLPAGSVSILLARLERHYGWLRSDDEERQDRTEPGAPRRFYQLTPEGERQTRFLLQPLQLTERSAGDRPDAPTAG